MVGLQKITNSVLKLRNGNLNFFGSKINGIELVLSSHITNMYFFKTY